MIMTQIHISHDVVCAHFFKVMNGRLFEPKVLVRILDRCYYPCFEIAAAASEAVACL